jgi:hypothetical protein
MMDRSSLLASRMQVLGRSVIYILKFKLVDNKTENLCRESGRNPISFLQFAHDNAKAFVK